MYDFLIVGHLAIDEVYVNGRARIGVGGSSYYCGFNLSLLGWRVCILSKIGFDFNLSLDNVENLDLSLVKSSSKPTTRYRIVYDSNYKRSLKLISKCEDILESDIPHGLKMKVIHICPIANEIDINAIDKLKKFKVILSIDVQGLLRAFKDTGEVYLKKPRNILDIVRDVNILKADQFEIKTILNSLTNVSTLFDVGIKIVIVTKGSKGVTVYTPNQTINIPALRVRKVQDPTGAGDVFTAGFLHGYLKGMSIKDSALYGIVLASNIIRKFESRLIEVGEVSKLFSKLEKLSRCSSSIA